MPKQVFRGGDQPPDEWDKDLRPNKLAGTNYGLAGPHPENDAATLAYNNKDIHRLWPELTDDELKHLSILPEGRRLEQGATYFDLLHPGRGEFTARGGATAGKDNWYIAKSEVEYTLWNRITGVTNPERLDMGNFETPA
jgi:hypothetical protein